MNKSKQLAELHKQMGATSSTTEKSPMQWRVWLGLLALLIITVMDWQWVWGALFLFWIIPDIRNKTTYFIEPVYRNQNPLLFWAIITLWISMSIFSFATLFIDFDAYFAQL